MFAALGDETGFGRWVVLLGGQATLAPPTARGGPKPAYELAAAR